MKNIVKGVLILVFVFVLFILLTFLIPFEKTGVFWLSFAFGMLALLSQIYVFYTAFKSDQPVRSRLYGFPIMRVGLIYLAVQIPLSFVFMSLGFTSLDVDSFLLAPLLIYLVLFCLFAVGLLSTELVRDKIEAQDAALKTNVAAMRALQGKIAVIAGECKDPATRVAMDELVEKFRYSDPVSSEATEELERSLFMYVNSLKSANADRNYEAMAQIAATVETTLAERNRLCRLTKGLH